MAVIFTGSSSTGYIADAGSDQYVVSEFSTISNEGNAFTFTTAQSSDLILAGSIYSSNSGVVLAESQNLSFNRFIVEDTGTIFAASKGMDVSGSDIRYTIRGTVQGASDAIEHSGNGGSIILSGSLDAGGDGLDWTGNLADIDITGQVRSAVVGIDLAGENGDIVNAGLILAEDIGIRVNGAGTVILNTGSILATDQYGIFSNGTGRLATQIVNEGTIMGRWGVYSATDGAEVFNAGTITGIDQSVNFLSSGGTLTNSGALNTLGSSNLGVTIDAPDVTFVNSGQVNSNLYVSDAGFTLRNTGTIDGDVILYSSSVDAELYNFGEIVGSIRASGPGQQTISNHGTIGGEVDLGAGNDIYRGSGEVLGKVYAGDGFDQLYGKDGDDHFNGGDNNDQMFGNKGDDTLNGDAGNDTIKGGAGDDVITGGNGGDDLMGGSGHDRIDGGNGADKINGGFGNDLLVGGAGADDFIFDRVAGDDRITGFVNGQDQIDLTAFGLLPAQFASDVLPAVTAANGFSVIIDFAQLGGSGSVIVQGLAIGNVDASDFIL